MRTAPAAKIGKLLRPMQLSGPDDTSDPYIYNEAAALNNDPQQIFNFVRDHIGYEAYKGSLRGARGTLWGLAGNALDRASLLVALLRSAGYNAQYVQGTLTHSQAKPLILSMFQNRYRFFGCLAPGTTTADPANDPALLSLAENHFWVQYQAVQNGPYINADTAFPGAQLGQSFGTQVSTSGSIPYTSQYTVAFEVDAETYTQASAAFAGNGISSTPVLNFSFASSQLVGKPVSIGQLVSNNSLGGLAIGATTNTYTPYLLIGEDPNSPVNDNTVTGTPFQEILTNFPLGSTVLTGLFVHITITDSVGASTTYDKTLFDRIGYAARSSGGAISVSADPTQAPALDPLNLTTFNVLPSLQDNSIVAQWTAVNSSLNSQLQNIQSQLPTSGVALTPAQSALQQQGSSLTTQLITNTERVLTGSFAYISGKSADTLAVRNEAWWYVDSPLLIAASSTVTYSSTNTTATMQFRFDLLKDDVQVIPYPGQNMAEGPAFRTDRGVLESYLEGQLFSAFSASQNPGPGVTVQLPVSATDIIQAAASQGIALTAITPATTGLVSSLNISADAKARIISAVGNGSIVTVPRQAVTIGGITRTGWFEIQADGTASGVLENGDHGVEDFVLTRRYAADPETAAFTGFLAGFVAGVIIDAVGLILVNSILLNGCPLDNLRQCFKFSVTTANIVSEIVSELLAAVTAAVVAATVLLPGYSLGFIAGLALATNGFTVAGILAGLLGDPPLPQSLLAGTVPPAASPGSSPGVQTTLTLDPNLTYPVGNAPLDSNDAQIPTVFDALITNTGPSADTFNIALLNPPAGFTLVGSLPSITIPAGAQAEINVCAIPSGSMPAPGTSTSFGVSATSTTNPAITSSSTAGFMVPSLNAASISANPSFAATTPGSPITVSLAISGLGNTSTSVALSASTDPNLTVSGLSSPVSVNAGQTVTQTLTITPGAGAPLNTQLYVSITGTFGVSQSSTVQIPVTLEAAQALIANTAASAAVAAGRADLASTLSGIAGAITAVVAGCTTSSLLTLQNYVQNMQTQFNSSFFYPAFVSLGFNIFGDIASATCATIAQPLAELNIVLNALNNLLSSPAAYPFQFAITPVSLVAQPNSTSTFKLQIQNQSNVTQTYNLAVTGIPGGLGDLNMPSVTLAPQQAVPAGVASDPAVVISQTGNALQSFSFTVFATPSTVPAGGQTATATVNLRPSVLQVQAVTAAPAFVNAGGSVDVRATIANTVNQPTSIRASLSVLNAASQAIASAGPLTTVLSDSGVLASVDFGQVAIPPATPNGNYTLSVTITDANGNPLTGGGGTGFLLVGSPVTASLTLSPTTVPTGNSTVLNTLTITPTGGNANSLNLVGSVATASSAQTIAINGNTAYACDQNEVSVIDITSKSAPAVLTTALSSYIANAANIHCDIRQGDLVIFSDTSSTTIGNNPGFLVFGLSNPQSPNLINSIPFNKRFVGDPIAYLGNTAFLYTNAVFHQFGLETGTAGDIVSVDVSNITNPQILGTLSTNGDPVYGGPSGFFGEALYNSSILYGTGTTLTGNNGIGGAAALDVIDIANPSSMTLSNQVTTSANGVQYLGSPLVQGNTLVALANSGATPNPETLVVFDISNPANPAIVSTTSTGTFCCAGGGAAILGPNEFLFSGTMNSTNVPMLLLVNTANPAAPVITPLAVTVAANDLVIQGNYLYAPTASGLSIYSIPGTALSSVITGYTARIQTANGGGVTYDPASFNIAPTTITSGAGFDTLEWDNPGVSTLTWNSNLTGFQTGQIATVDQGGTVTFTSTLGNGTVNIGPAGVGADQIIGLSPATQTLGSNYFGYPGAEYTVTVRNPTSASVTYNLTFAGITQAWLPAYPANLFPSSVTVPAEGTVNLTLNLSPPLTLPSATYPFEVIATAGGISGLVGGTVVLNNTHLQPPPTVGPGSPQTILQSDLALQASPATGTTGPGGTVIFQVQMTNVGPYADTYNVGSQGNPTVGVARGAFTTPLPTIAPGQTFTDTLAVQVPANAPVGTFPITIYASGTMHGGTSQIQAMINVVNSGVALSLSPYPIGIYPGTPMQLTVTNTGTTPGTFNLSSAGPEALLITLSVSTVTLAAGASQVVNVTLGSPSFATTGTLPFSIGAQSTSNPATNASVNGSLYIPSSFGVTAAFQPASQTIPLSGPAVFPLSVHNVGSVEDGYSAQITGITGQVTASLTNIDGSLTQSIPNFHIPGQSLAQLNLSVTPTGAQGGTAVVTITSMTDSTVTASATATLGASSAPPVLPPNASAVSGLTVPANRLAMLDASASTDPNTPALPLTFAWVLVSRPTGSALTNSSIAFPASALAAFRPDVAGTYVFGVTVSNGQAIANANATYQAADLPPVALVNQPFNAGTGAFAFLNGDHSYDPDGQAITFAWTVLSAPPGSAVTTGSLNNAQTPRPFFTPDVAGAYNLQLIVTDATAPSTPATVIVTAYSGTIPPNADAGRPTNAGTGHVATVSGSGSSDPNATPLPLNYQWTFGSTPAGSAVTNAGISGATSATPSFTPDVPGDYALNLVVSNANGTSQPAMTTVHAFAGNVPPHADAGANQFTTPNGTVTLSSTGSADPDNGPLPPAYLWWLDSLPAVSAASLTHPLTATPQFVADKPGYYVARVETTDGLSSGFANTLVTSAAVCDADANGTVNATDIALIQAALGRMALANDPRDFDHDGAITAADVTGCSNLIAQPAPPTLQLSPTSYTLTVAQGAAASAQAIQVSSSGSALNFTISSNQPWLTSSLASGSTASISSINAQINPARLGPGTYTGSLTFTPDSGAAQAVTATLVIEAPQPPPPPSSPPLAILNATPSSLQFSLTGCSAPVSSLTFSLTSSVAGLNYAVQTNVPWLTVSPQFGLTSGATVTVSVNEAKLAAGVNSGSVTISGPGAASLTVPVTVMVGAGNPLVVTPVQLTLSAASGGRSTAQTLAINGACGALAYTVQADQPWLSTGGTGGQTPAQLTVTASALTLPQGSYTGHLTIASPGASNSPVVIPVTFAVGAVPPGVGVVYSAVNAASFIPGPIAPGSLFSIFGANFTGTATSATDLPLPTQLSGVSVSINSVALPLLYAGPSQINAQAPYELTPGPVQLTVTSNGNLVGTLTVQVAATNPGIFVYPAASGHAAARNSDFSLNSAQAPDQPGSYLFAVVTGLGAVTPSVSDGSAAPSTPSSYTVARVTATIGGQDAAVTFAGLAPTFAGVSQLNIIIPNLPPGDYPLVVTADGVVSNAATVTIGQ